LLGGSRVKERSWISGNKVENPAHVPRREVLDLVYGKEKTKNDNFQSPTGPKNRLGKLPGIRRGSWGSRAAQLPRAKD